MAESVKHIINLDRLNFGQYQYDFVLDSEYFSQQEKSEIIGGNVAVHVALNWRSEDLDVVVSVRGKVSLTCDRCLDLIEFDVEAEEDMAPLLEEEFFLEKGTTGRNLDLEWLAYELVVVNLPLVHCHPEGGCNPQMDALLQDHLCRTLEEPETQN